MGACVSEKINLKKKIENNVKPVYDVFYAFKTTYQIPLSVKMSHFLYIQFQYLNTKKRK